MFFIRTGIPALDDLFRQKAAGATDLAAEGGVALPNLTTSTSVCLVGPDGTGKSVLAMHLVSRYLADCAEFATASPCVCYVSSDLTHPIASEMWTNFALDLPNARRIPFKHPQFSDELLPEWIRMWRQQPNRSLTQSTYLKPRHLSLRQCCPGRPTPAAARSGAHDVSRYLMRPEFQVGFIDLASQSAGDDWGFVERLMAVLPEPKDGPLHLVVVDSVDGMETFAGDFDAFGEHDSRRGRVARLMRLSFGKAHVVFIVEESADGTRRPEQFVTDVVIHLRSSDAHGYMRRTLEIEKARGQPNVRGRHPYVIRSGRGSTTGTQANSDDPIVPVTNNVAFLRDGSGPHLETQSYVDVFRSLHYSARMIMEHKGLGKEKPPSQVAAFGIPYLDDMLVAREPQQLYGDADRRTRADSLRNSHGLPSSTITALIGDAGTQKTALGSAFLGHAFMAFAQELLLAPGPPDAPASPAYRAKMEAFWNTPAAAHDIAAFWRSCKDSHRRGAQRIGPGLMHLSKQACFIYELGQKTSGVAVLITTQDENNRTLAESFLQQLRHELPALNDLFRGDRTRDYERLLTTYLESRTICRRLELHDTTSAILLHAIRRCIESAQQVLTFGHADVFLADSLSDDAGARYKASWPIRFVIDDLAAMMDAYGQIRADPLFLPFLMFYVRREGPTTLIIDTHPGKPDPEGAETFHADLRALSDNRLYTWRVTEFFGDHRVAIAVIPPIARESNVLVRELRWKLPSDRGSIPVVHPDFELYSGLEQNRPQLIPLRIQLFGETTIERNYIADLNREFQRMFRSVSASGESSRSNSNTTTDDPASSLAADAGSIVVAESPSNYDELRQFCNLQTDTKLDYTSVLQVDEFWGDRGMLRPASTYLNAVVTDSSGQHDTTADPYGSYEQPLLSKGIERRTSSGANPHRLRKADFFEPRGYDLSSSATTADSIDRVPFMWDFGFLACRGDAWDRAAQKKRGSKALQRVWRYSKSGGSTLVHGDWRQFLGAAREVAQSESKRLSEPVPAFDITTIAPEAFSCLIMELWLSEIVRSAAHCHRPRIASTLVAQLSRRSWRGETGAAMKGLLEWLSGDGPTIARGYRDPQTMAFRGFSLELYKAWLLLIETLDLTTLENPVGAPRFHSGHKVNPLAVASRWWYNTASAEGLEHRQDIAPSYHRLPGSFTTRGDWFLAVARGSRSNRLADRALDLLCSVPNNAMRLLHGIGLPTRRLGRSDDLGRLRTSLGWSRLGETSKHFSYAELIQRLGEGDGYYWLWRSSIKSYNRHADIWHNWLYRIARRWQGLREFEGTRWVDGFEIYDALDKLYRPGHKLDRAILDLTSFNDFPKRCEDLVSSLSAVG